MSRRSRRESIIRKLQEKPKPTCDCRKRTGCSIRREYGEQKTLTLHYLWLLFALKSLVGGLCPPKLGAPTASAAQPSFRQPASISHSADENQFSGVHWGSEIFPLQSETTASLILQTQRVLNGIHKIDIHATRIIIKVWDLWPTSLSGARFPWGPRRVAVLLWGGSKGVVVTSAALGGRAQLPIDVTDVLYTFHETREFLDFF